MTLCKRCGVEYGHKEYGDKRETKEHCGFCSEKLGIKVDIDYGTHNVITDPRNSGNFILIAIGITILAILMFAYVGAFEDQWKAESRDDRVAHTILSQDLTPEFCEKAKQLKATYRANSNGYVGDTKRAIDSVNIDCEFNKIFDDFDLKPIPNNQGNNRR